MVTLYTTDACPRCIILADKLNEVGIEFIKTTEVQKIIDAGFKSVPVLEIKDGKFLDFKESIEYIKNKGETV